MSKKEYLLWGLVRCSLLCRSTFLVKPLVALPFFFKFLSCRESERCSFLQSLLCAPVQERSIVSVGEISPRWLRDSSLEPAESFRFCLPLHRYLDLLLMCYCVIYILYQPCV